MTRILDTQAPDFADAFDRLLRRNGGPVSELGPKVTAIIQDVATRGDAAVIDYTTRFDRITLDATGIAFSDAEIDAHCQTVSDADRAALECAAERIRAYHAKQMPQDAFWEDKSGAELGWRWGPVDAAGLYVPGGLASYPSSVLMNAIPARVAGVARLVVCFPTPSGAVNPLVLFACKLAGVSEIYRIGGAQAIAAMAYGTDTIRPVDKITGPGNAYVAEAKRQVFGQVGIDMIAGPSEVAILADAGANPDWVALDLLAQAEHDAEAQSILITTDKSFATAAAKAVEARLETLQRREIAGASWRDHGAVIIAQDWDEAADLTNRIAPEHLEICIQGAETLSRKIRHAGAIFIGSYTPEAIGDYVGGPNHVLPTSRSARFSSGLSVLDFMKRTTISRMTPGALSAIGPAAVQLAASEGLEAHGLSVSARLATLNESVKS